MYTPRGSIYSTIMEFGPPNHNRDCLLVPNSIMVVQRDPLGIKHLRSPCKTLINTRMTIFI